MMLTGTYTHHKTKQVQKLTDEVRGAFDPTSVV